MRASVSFVLFTLARPLSTLGLMDPKLPDSCEMAYKRDPLLGPKGLGRANEVVVAFIWFIRDF